MHYPPVARSIKTKIISAVCSFGVLTTLLGVGLLVSGMADEPKQLIDHPGFRPDVECGRDAAFRSGLSSMEITVLPTVVRTVQGTRYDEWTRNELVKLWKELGVAEAKVADEKLDLSMAKPERPGQYGVFLKGLEQVGEFVRGQESGQGHVMLVELLV